MASIFRKVRQALCGVAGHENLMHFTADRVCLQCMSCGYETPGWSMRPDAACAPSPHYELLSPSHAAAAPMRLFLDVNHGGPFAQRSTRAS